MIWLGAKYSSFERMAGIIETNVGAMLIDSETPWFYAQIDRRDYMLCAPSEC